MKKIVLFITLAVVLACASQKNVQIQNSENTEEISQDGSSFAKAIIVFNVPEEYTWIKNHYPGSQFLGQALVFNNRKPFDILTIKTADGVEKKVHFDIHKFYGKF